ncbi:hypothetical protein M758_12G077600 [Ceratodon purpureus]|uniref:Glycoside hydrolase family 19 catalytic domain-containing protein n=1 Tax=Ceratodon purpureus TaxID=3225 RepID=A0A8T0G599_CERPU|nr:hypothetical protein KC19_12G074800 [Ceratodon purpureus]KAG0598480.1 hypothetical protein M758_12G077600 [Ceratodon purpureus]
MTRSGDLHRPVVAAVLAIAALLLHVSVASAQGFASILTEARFQTLFPKRNSAYTYAGFKAAVASAYPKFGNEGSPADQKREVAAFLANVEQETGGLVYIYEQNKNDVYCDLSTPEARKYPCASGKRYIGRGPLQLTWNYNYGACGNALNIPLLADPGLATKDSETLFKTALWFWMTRGCHEAILRKSFSGTIRAINGGLECNQPAGSAGNTKMKNRVQYYKNFCQALDKVDPGTDLEC